MRGWLVLRDNPYMAVTDADGRFAIKNLPVGEHEFVLWHERIGYLRELAIGSKKTSAKGRLTMTIQPGENDLPTTPLRPSLFEPD